MELQLAREAAERAAEARRKADAAGERQRRRDAEAGAKLQTLRYADGSREIHAGRRTLEVGDFLKRNGETWRVLPVDVDAEGNVVVRLDSEAA
jgi:hypothetical protein